MSPLGKLKRSAVDNYLLTRGLTFNKPLNNLFMATVQKTGSQWFRAVLSDHRVQRITGLRTFRQRRYEYTEFRRRFPKGTFVPGLYMSYDLYEEIGKPDGYKTFYVLRDPRDIVVSWYWSMKDTHGLMGKVPKYRSVLQSLDFDDGLHYCIDAFHMKLACMRSWINNRGDQDVLFVRFEDMKSNPAAVLNQILNFCELEFDQKCVKKVVSDYSKERMREIDLKKRLVGSESHYRAKSSNHKYVFKDSHYDHFYSTTGDLVQVLGYPST